MKDSLYWFIVSALGYLIAGKIGLTLAIPPGFASAVWPASGVALGCLLIGQRIPVTLGIIASSCLINLSIASNSFEHINLATFIAALVISLGAALQANLGDWLYRRFIGVESLIDSSHNILYFVLLVVCVGCMIAPTVGVSTLHYFGIISTENFNFSWLTWWAGDAIGVLLFMPMLLIFFSKRNDINTNRRWLTAIPTFFIFSGVLVLFFYSTQKRQNEIRTSIEENANRFFYSLEKNVQSSFAILTSYSGLFRASSNVDFEEFMTYSETILPDNSVINAIGWTEIIPLKDRSAVEKKFQNLGFTDFQFREPSKHGGMTRASDRSRYFPVLYIYPFSENSPALGLDLGFNSDRLRALEQAKASKKIRATAPINLVQVDDKKAIAIIAYLPVFRDKVQEPNNSNNFIGYISGVFKIEGLIGALVEDANVSRFGVNISDVTTTSNPLRLHRSDLSPLSGFDSVERILDFAGRQYKVNFYAGNQLLLSSKDWTSFTILTIGFVIAALLQSFILILTGRTESIEREVLIKTKDLNEAKVAAENANRSKSEFTANISHEIRTPLNAIIGFLNQCLKTDLSDKQTDYLNKIKLASETLLGLINNTLDFSKIEAGRLEVESIRFNLNRLLDKINAIFSHVAESKAIGFEIHTLGVLPSFLIGDQLRLEQVLLNLCSNALKFTNRGRIALYVKSITKENQTEKRQSNRQVETLQFRIIDTGIGISDVNQKNLFQSFQQADTSTSRKFGGTGLGLAISQSLVSLMGGNIKLKSVEHEGSEFIVTLPFEVDDRQDKEAECGDSDSLAESLEKEPNKNESAKSNNLPEANCLADQNILVVDDVEMNQIIAQEILQEYGATVTLAENGLDAIEKLKSSSSTDIILMDIQMPEMDGYEATKIIKSIEQFKKIPIIAMTANAMNEDIEKSRESGMQDHIAKPIDELVLIRSICEYI